MEPVLAPATFLSFNDSNIDPAQQIYQFSFLIFISPGFFCLYCEHFSLLNQAILLPFISTSLLSVFQENAFL